MKISVQCKPSLATASPGVTAYLQTPTVPPGSPCRESFCTECASKCVQVQHLPIWADLTNMAAGCPAGEPGWHTGGSLPPVGSGRGPGLSRESEQRRAQAPTGTGSHNRCIIGPGTCRLLFCGETSVLTRANHLMPVNH